ncbi:hypothetical protein B0H12DRAFT_1157666 [Mycena haematopus]|nr:hypothetical protein B0H12DRAFT_1157666 [Mycena haematopus]
MPPSSDSSVTLSHLFSVLVLAALLHCSPSLDIYLFPCLSPGAPTLLPHIHATSASNISGNMPPCTQRAPVGSYERDISDGYTSSGGNQYAGGEGSEGIGASRSHSPEAVLLAALAM